LIKFIEKLDEFTESYRSGDLLIKRVWRTEVTIPEVDFLEAKELYKILKTENSYKIRVDPSSTLTIFSNNKDFLLEIIKKLKKTEINLWEPNKKYIELLQKNSKIILVDKKPDLPYKINFNNKKCNKDFARWVRANRDKCRMGNAALLSLEDFGYLNGYYMFVRDEKILNIVTLLAGMSVRNVEKLVYKDNIDK